MIEESLSFALNGIDQPHQVALILLAHVLNKPKTWVLAHPETHLNPDQKARLEHLVSRLQEGEPLPYLTGKQAFYGLEFAVNPDVLIPRPETELLVEEALDWLAAHPNGKTVLEVGTGSGCIAISLATCNTRLAITATDISSAALKLARQNAAIHQVSAQITFTQADLLPNTSDTFDLVCANLPYIPSQKLSSVNTHGFEPNLALDGGADGLRLIRRLLDHLPSRLNYPSVVLLEIEASLGAETLELAYAAFPNACVTLIQDLAGLDRLVRIELS